MTNLIINLIAGIGGGLAATALKGDFSVFRTPLESLMSLSIISIPSVLLVTPLSIFKKSKKASILFAAICFCSTFFVMYFFLYPSTRNANDFS